MPRHDFSTPPQRQRDTKVVFLRPFWRPRRKPGKDAEDGGVPADPRKPKDSSGGAAVTLDFSDE
jgi:hypothetical protein